MFMFNVLINKAFQLFTFRFAPDLARNGIGVRGWTGATFSALFIFFIWSYFIPRDIRHYIFPFLSEKSKPFELCDPLLFRLEMK